MNGMTNGDFIRSMTDQQMEAFLFLWGVNSISSFMEHGGSELMNAVELMKWLKSDDFHSCRQTRIEEGFNLNEDYTPIE